MCAKFKAAHCGFCNERMSERMYQSWTARNDAMAYSIASMVQEDSNQPIAMIIGGGHTQHNMAVFERVTFFRPSIKQVNVGIQEVAIKPVPAETYMEKTMLDGREFLPAHEYIWFTDRASYEDPCEQFFKQMSKMKKVPPSMK